jgi:spore maturation protein CgeB
MNQFNKNYKLLNIIFVGDLNSYTRSNQRANALKQISNIFYEISHTNIEKNKIYRYSLIEKIFIKLRIKYDKLGFNKKILQIDLIKFDLVWIDGCLNLKNSTIKKAKKLNKNLNFLYFSEDDFLKKHNNNFFHMEHLSLYDYVVTTKKRIYNQLLDSVKNIILVSDTYSNFLLQKTIKLKPDILLKKNLHKYLVSFIGAYEYERANSLIYLANKGIDIHVWGNGWQKHHKQFKNLIIYNKFLKEEELVEVICNSKINLNFLRKKNNDQITSRSIEIPSYGGFVLSELTADHLEIYPSGERILFKDDEDLLIKINYFLKYEDIREHIRNENENKFRKENYSIEKITNYILQKITNYENINK